MQGTTQEQKEDIVEE